MLTSRTIVPSKTIITSGHEIPRDQLRISAYATVFHDVLGQLCEGENHYCGTLYHPIRFKSREAAGKWINNGCIAELQESLTNLNVGFRTISFAPRNQNV